MNENEQVNKNKGGQGVSGNFAENAGGNVNSDKIVILGRVAFHAHWFKHKTDPDGNPMPVFYQGGGRDSYSEYFIRKQTDLAKQQIQKKKQNKKIEQENAEDTSKDTSKKDQNIEQKSVAENVFGNLADGTKNQTQMQEEYRRGFAPLQSGDLDGVGNLLPIQDLNQGDLEGGDELQSEHKLQRPQVYYTWRGGSCAECSSLDGETFLDGSEPGSIHPNCGCSLELTNSEGQPIQSDKHPQTKQPPPYNPQNPTAREILAKEV